MIEPVQTVMLRHYNEGARLILIAPGNIRLDFLENELKRVVIGKSINMMDVAHDDLPSQVESVMTRLAMLGVYSEKDSISRSVLLTALEAIYLPLWQAGRQDDSMFTMPLLKDLQAGLNRISTAHESPDVRDAAQVLSFRLNRFVKSSAREWFQQTTADFSLQHRLIVFDISNMEREIGVRLPPLRNVLLETLISKITYGIHHLRLRGVTDPIMFFFVDDVGVLRQVTGHGGNMRRDPYAREATG